jgi:hypothetical protein
MANDSELVPPRITDWKKILFLPAIALSGAVLLVFFLFDPARVAMFPACQFHQLTGLDCPGCGAQRALHQLLHGHLIAAIRLNAMFVISLPLLAWFGPRFLSRLLKSEPLTLNTRWLWIYVTAWIAFGVLRNLPYPIFAWFAA